MSKQTAVEWLGFELNFRLFFKVSEKEWDEIKEVFKQALVMEREQIKNAWHAGVSDSDDAKSYYNDHFRATSEKYYNKTYKGGEQ